MLPLSQILTVKRSSVLLASILSCGSVGAVNLNYDSLSSLEEPIAMELGDTTIILNGLVDSALFFADVADDDSFISGNFQVSAETQLANSLTLGASYFGAYSGRDENTDDAYRDNAAIYLGGVWGTVALGNVTGLVREQTRRRRAVGNGVLVLDDHLGQLEDDGVSYIGRFGPNQLVLSADEDGGYEIGGTYQRPLGNKDYRFSLRFRDSQFTSDDTLTTFDSRAIGFVSELTFGSSVFDLGIGVEHLSSNQVDADRNYVSIGASHKIGTWSASAEAHFGDIEGDSERSYAVGIQYDIARGLSLNLGLNYAEAVIVLDGVRLLDDADTAGIASLRYSF